MTTITEVKTFPVIFLSGISKGKSLRERSYFIEANRESTYTHIKSDMTVKEITDLARKKMGIEKDNIEIACWDDDGSILMLKKDGSNLSKFMLEIYTHCFYMQETFKELGAIGNWHFADGENAACIMVKV